MVPFLVNYKVRDDVTSQIKDLFSTPKGTIALDPDYGLDFSVIDTDAGLALDLNEFKITIRDLLDKYVPRVNAQKAKIKVEYHRNTGGLIIHIDDLTVNLVKETDVPRVNVNLPDVPPAS